MENESLSNLEILNSRLGDVVREWTKVGKGLELQPKVAELIDEGFDQGYHLIAVVSGEEEGINKDLKKFRAKKETEDGFYQIEIKTNNSEMKSPIRPYMIMGNNRQGFIVTNSVDQVIVVYPEDIVSLEFILPENS